MIRPLDTLTAVVLATRMRARDAQEVTACEGHEDPVAWAAANALRPGISWALVSDAKEPVAMGGARFLWPGVVETWLVATDALPKHAVELLRAVRDLHARLVTGGTRRFQTMCQVGYDGGHRFLFRLGYHIEGRARAFGKRGEAYDYLARIEGDT